MKPLRNRLQEARKRLGIPWEILERGYVLSWLLAGISPVEALHDTLIFKGGTALDEKILKPVQKRSIIHDYGEPLAARCPIKESKILFTFLRVIGLFLRSKAPSLVFSATYPCRKINRRLSQIAQKTTGPFLWQGLFVDSNR